MSSKLPVPKSGLRPPFKRTIPAPKASGLPQRTASTLSKANVGPVPTFDLDTKVQVVNSGKIGFVRYSGETKFAPGPWCGVELTTADGKNDGTVQGVEYFKCEQNYGVFVRPTAINKLSDDDGSGDMPPKTQKSPTSIQRKSIVPPSTKKVLNTLSPKPPLSPKT